VLLLTESSFPKKLHWLLYKHTHTHTNTRAHTRAHTHRGAAVNGGLAALLARRSPVEEALAFARSNFRYDNRHGKKRRREVALKGSEADARHGVCEPTTAA